MLKFSVLMSVYKNEKTEYLKQAIESIVSQTLIPNEIIIVKDGVLTDELNQVIEYYTDNYKNLFRIINFSENRGLGLALREGVMACYNEYIARMDTDDIALPDRFEKQFNYLVLHPEIAILGSWVREFSNNTYKPDTETKLPCTNEEILIYAKKRNPFRHMSVVFRKSAVIQSGNYRDFLWFEDYDLWVRMLSKGYKGANLPLYLMNVRAGNDMFKRRGGWKYLKQDINFQRYLLKISFTNLYYFIFNILVRVVIRMVPNYIRVVFYRYALRDRIKES